MSKKRLELSIEEDILQKAKKQIPNLSEFFEGCLKYYLGEAEGMYSIIKDQEILENIGILQAKLFMNKQKYNMKEELAKAESHKLNSTWFQLWNDFRRNFTVNERFMDEAVNVLGVDAEILEDMLYFTDVNRDYFGIEFTWEDVCELYEKEEK